MEGKARYTSRVSLHLSPLSDTAAIVGYMYPAHLENPVYRCASSLGVCA